MDAFYNFCSMFFLFCCLFFLLVLCGMGEKLNKPQTPRQVEIKVRYDHYLHLTGNEEAAATLVLAETQQEDDGRPD